MFRNLTLLAGGLVLLAVLPVQAQQTLDGPLYGRGTHAYFSGDYVKAHDLLTAVIDADARDPRAFYFRGLVYLRLNRPEEARLDFEKGSDLEATDSNAFYDVSQSLVRVQGRQRLAIEEYRARARLAAAKRSKAVHRARFEAIRHEEDRVVRKNVSLTPGTFAAPGEKQSAVAEADPGKSPAAVANERPATPPATESDPFAASPAAAESDPFAPAPAAPDADPFAPAPAATDEDPFAESPATPAPAGDATPGAPKSGGLWGAIGKAMEKTMGPSESTDEPPVTPSGPPVPFKLPGFGKSDSAAEPPASTTPPPARPAEEAEDDPFGTPASTVPATPGTPAPATPPPAKPAEEAEDDPFGAPASAAPATPGTPAPATPPPAKPAEEAEDPFAEATKPEPSPSARPVGIPVSQGQGGSVNAEAADKNSQGGSDKKPDTTKKAEESRSPVAPIDENPFKEE